MKTTSYHSSPFPIIKKSKVVHAGFTLLEMVIVLGIIAMIMGGAIFVMKGISDSGAITVVDGDFTSIDNALLMYKTTAGGYPSGQQGLKVLVERPASARRGRWTQILEKVPKDPWNNEYIYKYPGSKNSSRPELISLGKDGLEGTEDDMSSQDPR